MAASVSLRNEHHGLEHFGGAAATTQSASTLYEFYTRQRKMIRYILPESGLRWCLGGYGGYKRRCSGPARKQE